jgi:hypothetical protein
MSSIEAETRDCLWLTKRPAPRTDPTDAARYSQLTARPSPLGNADISQRLPDDATTLRPTGGVEELLNVVADASDKQLPDIARACVAALGARFT